MQIDSLTQPPDQWYTNKKVADRIARIRELAIDFRNMAVAGEGSHWEAITEKMNYIEANPDGYEIQFINLSDTRPISRPQVYFHETGEPHPRLIELTHFISDTDGNFVTTKDGEIMFFPSGIFNFAPEREFDGTKFKTLPILVIDPKDTSPLNARHIAGLRYVATDGDFQEVLRVLDEVAA